MQFLINVCSNSFPLILVSLISSLCILKLDSESSLDPTVQMLGVEIWTGSMGLAANQLLTSCQRSANDLLCCGLRSTAAVRNGSSCELLSGWTLLVQGQGCDLTLVTPTIVNTSPLQKGRSCSLAVWKLYLATHSVPVDHGTCGRRRGQKSLLNTHTRTHTHTRARAQPCKV